MDNKKFIKAVREKFNVASDCEDKIDVSFAVELIEELIVKTEQTAKSLGCNKVLNAYTSCGDINFSNKIVLCEDCHNKAKDKILKAVRKKWEAEREHCDDCEVGHYCATCKPEFEKLNEDINVRKILENYVKR